MATKIIPDRPASQSPDRFLKTPEGATICEGVYQDRLATERDQRIRDAAPDLLLACKELLVYLGEIGEPLGVRLEKGEPTKRAWAAIAKATAP